MDCFFTELPLDRSLASYDLAIQNYQQYTTGRESILLQLNIWKISVLLAQNDIAQARNTMNAVDSIRRNGTKINKAETCLYHYETAYLANLENNLEKAKAHIQQYQPCKGQFYKTYGLLLQAQIAKNNNQPQQAKALLEQSLELWQRFPNDHLGIKIQIENAFLLVLSSVKIL